MKLELSVIRIDGGTQARAGIDQETVAEYRAAIEAGDTFPPLTVFHDGAVYWLADGFHRWHALNIFEAREVEADVQQGERRDAVLYSVGANATHGLRRTNDDKRRAVTVLLEDDEWQHWPNREIARRVGVSDVFVGNMKRELSANRLQIEDTGERTVTRGGTTYVQNTANIGRSQPTSYTPKVTPEQPEEDDRPVYDPYADDDGLELVQPDAEIISGEDGEEDEPYIPPYLSNPNRPTYEVKKLSNEPKPKDPPFVVAYTQLGRVRSMGHRTLIDGLNSVENEMQEHALENQIKDVIEILRASLKQAEIERKTVTA